MPHLSANLNVVFGAAISLVVSGQSQCGHVSVRSRSATLHSIEYTTLHLLHCRSKIGIELILFFLITVTKTFDYLSNIVGLVMLVVAKQR